MAKKTAVRLNIAHLKGIVFTAFFFSLFIIVLGMGQYTAKRLFVLSFAGFFAAGVILDIAVSCMPAQAARFLAGEKLSEKLYARFTDRQLQLILWLVISLSFAPAYLALFPGTFGYDAPIQAAQYFEELKLTAANPLLHTYLLGIFISFGEKVLKNASLGFALFILIQGLLAAHVLSRSFLFLKRIHTPLTAMAAGLLWILFNPTLHVLTFNATKDILLGVCFLHFLLNLLDAALYSADGISQNARSRAGRAENASLPPPVTRSACLPDGKLPCANPHIKETGCIRLLISAILMCLMRNAAIYLVAALILFLLPSFRKYKGILLSLCLAFLISWLSALFFTKALDIPAGNARENLCIPIQQLAAVSHSAHYGTEPVNITPQQLDAIHELIPEETLTVFLRDTVDLVKADFRTEVYLEDTSRYLSLYLAVGRQNPGIYIRAFRDLVLPYFDMSRSTRRLLSLEETFPGLSHLRISRSNLFPAYFAYLEDRIGTEHYGFILQPGLSVWLAFLGIGVAINRKNNKILLCILPLMLYFIGILLGPMALLRYLYPMMMATPLLFGICFWKKE